jgi:predicted RNA binding protein YcfA (HicA-like mRNA interferase family)
MPTIRDAIELVQDDGWTLVRTRGSHRIYIHRFKPGVVVIAGRPGKDLATGTWNSILKQAGQKKGQSK